MNRRALSVALCLAIAGCAAKEFKPLEFAPPVPLQEPLPGLAIVYLLRAPHDSGNVDVTMNGAPVARLPAETYTAVNLRPGSYAITTADASDSTAYGPNADSMLTVAAGERRFFYTSVPSRTTDSIGVAFVGRAGAIPLVSPVTVRAGQRTWHECNELDAQGLMSISKLVSPARQLL